MVYLVNILLTDLSKY